jgi:hypothetical protein
MKSTFKLLGIIALTALILLGMAGCGDGASSGGDGGGGGGGGSLPTAGDGSLSGGNTPSIPGGNVPGTLSTAYSGPGFMAACRITNSSPRQLLTTLFSGGITVTVVSGTSVSFTLKEPVNGVLFNWTDWPMWPPQMLSNFTVTPAAAKGFGISGFLEADNKTCKELVLVKNDGSSVDFVWADQDVDISYGPSSFEGSPIAINMALKAGWNTVISKWTSSGITIVSGPASGFHWVIRDQD